MNVPNALTITRIVLTPVVLAAYMLNFPAHFLVATILYFIAGMTDFFDGKIARSKNLITNFGKFADPLADKMLTTAVYLALISNGYCNIWILFIILFREFGISSIRLVAAAQGVVIPANMWGKVKTFSMMIFTGFIFLLLSLQFDFGVLPASFPLHTLSSVLLWITAIVTAISGVTYIIEGAKVIDFSK
ncbi:MAG: CDP-diacylglycerol--glycerol-3-phosphate 3-phosphatidyltransferase [Acutalibacteraceae bacterium]|nr:CDP-diacylglycerol--glycerol-3-phosphate 3-phosphatidyltransferase [Clostridia bacterium]MEE1292068.1 CDP-diacylglycerol--glycerol-3-phosphate 3-phosphatidyltransferase [Acutalibacteraceae bacterium]MBQ1528646.1 CDP-diacylglycerol--glycerol-3-phosphate 3-phosphatidyltransferase [Clostridia bacterium]MBQ1707288.1 CDP-diacylglycerol--glycerol-3-phosphate 3-phosphatidyltransferase [Clostridia bacterium]MBQ5579828.1 CDP-diacylglycerol--glycerol-3-phosphate 3-phosphatidyltransferase [Clostridia b